MYCKELSSLTMHLCLLARDHSPPTTRLMFPNGRRGWGGSLDTHLGLEAY